MCSSYKSFERYSIYGCNQKTNNKNNKNPCHLDPFTTPEKAISEFSGIYGLRYNSHVFQIVSGDDFTWALQGRYRVQSCSSNTRHAPQRRSKLFTGPNSQL
jgi:hypothetical protein